eukprot:SAG22_NODE_55_length_23749_cov_24.622918_13_plen_56_part_00
MSDAMCSTDFSPSDISITPSSQPLITSPTPTVNENGSSRSTDESNFTPVAASVPV